MPEKCSYCGEEGHSIQNCPKWKEKRTEPIAVWIVQFEPKSNPPEGWLHLKNLAFTSKEVADAYIAQLLKKPENYFWAYSLQRLILVTEKDVSVLLEGK